ncbi:MAG TPA: DnaB-like helicase C-terminal domain-containing protein [Solirubrobacteraceae bacterium]|nr:DnaB-like helicase C-terminal domain-containing protein [Solirubrobacteraceae bacterium]
MTTITPPHDLKAEEAVLGAILLSAVPLKKLIVDVGLIDAAFYRELHGRIWNGMVQLAMAGEPVDELTLKARLEAEGASPQETAKLGELSAAVPSAWNVVAYAQTVMDLAEWRGVLAASYELQAAVAERDADKREQAERTLTQARRGKTDTYSATALTEAVYAHIEGKEQVPTWATPWPTLNNALGGGLRAGEVTLLGGWTSMGKSVVADQLLRWCADKGAKVHAYINEMSPTVRGLRLVAAMTGVPQSRLAQPSKLTPDDHDKITKHLGRGLPFGITQVASWTADTIARDIRFQGWDVCALDLVHRLQFSDERELALISTALNAAAQVSGTHLIAVIHLNQGRAVGSTLPPPVLRDIRGTGMLANDADNVLFIHREEDAQDESGIPVKTENAALYLAKCRNGRLDKIDLTFDARHTRFLEPVNESRVVPLERRLGSDRGA